MKQTLILHSVGVFRCRAWFILAAFSTSAKVRVVKNDANIKETMADEGFGFQAKVK